MDFPKRGTDYRFKSVPFAIALAYIASIFACNTSQSHPLTGYTVQGTGPVGGFTEVIDKQHGGENERST
jgi:hypothetical protein